MSLPTRTTLILIMLLAFAAGLEAQDVPTATPESARPASTTADADAVTAETGTDEPTITEEPAAQPSYEIRNQFMSLLRQSPDELPRLLVLDPSLMSNAEFLLAYPTLAKFLQEHPQVLRHPRYYLEDFQAAPPRSHVLGDVLEVLWIAGILGLVAFSLGWFIRTVNDQKRWNRLYRTQSEVHNKILDRFSSTEEVLTYVKSPAGSRFLEAAPIPIHVETSPKNPPLTRVIWSIQIGVVLAAAAAGLLLVSLRLDADAAEELFALGVIAFCIGVGFVASAGISLFLSRRLGLWQDPKASEVAPAALNDQGLMR